MLAAGCRLHHSREVEADPSLGWCLGIFGWCLLEADDVLELVGSEAAWDFVADQHYSLNNLGDDRGRWVVDSLRDLGGWW